MDEDRSFHYLKKHDLVHDLCQAKTAIQKAIQLLNDESCRIEERFRDLYDKQVQCMTFYEGGRCTKFKMGVCLNDMKECQLIKKGEK